MEFTADDLKPLKQALISGVSSVSVSGGRTATFRSLAELKEIIADIEASIAAANPTLSPVVPNKVRATFRK